MKNLFKKTMLLALAAALMVASLPFVSVSAAGADDPTPPPQGEVTDERLERVWARQQRLYERLGKGFDHADEFTERIQSLIDRAEENGKDASAVQSALDAFEAAIEEAQPIYESGKDIVNSHQGFDENGKVTDLELAKETVQAMHEKMEEIKTAMNGTGKALREAIKAFRQANPRPTTTPAP
ncbi:MAG: hypothetical protein HXY35_11570 [Chloroflexi bacterium]|nr:hypothetical protein [Chloroflexota bacterium]